MKIRGNTVGTTMKRPDFNQTDERKSDYILNNPIPVINEGDEGKIPMVKDGAYVLKEKNSILELVQDIFAFDEEGPSTKKAPSQLATMNAFEGYMPSGAFNSHVEETIIPMQKRIGTLETTSEAHGEAINSMGNSIDENASNVHALSEEVGGIRLTVNENEERITDIEDRVSGQYVLLEEITTEEELTEYNYRPANNGRNPLKVAYVRIELAAHSAASSSGGQLNIYFYGVNDWTSCCSASSTIHNRVRVVSVQAINEYGKWRALKTDADNRYNSTVTQMCPANPIHDCNITRIALVALTEGIAIPVGTKISIWGVEI